MDRNIRVLGAGAGLRSFGLCFVGPFAALYLVRVAGLSFLAVGLVLAVISVPPLVVSPLGGLLTDRAGRRRVFALSLLGEAGAMAVTAVGVFQGSSLLFVLGLAGSGLLAAAGGPALSAYVADVAVGSERTVGFTWIRIGGNIGFAAGVAAGGIAVGSLGFFVAAVLATGIVAGGGVWMLLKLDPSPFDRGLPGPGASRRGISPLRGILAISRDRRFLIASLAFALATLVTAQWNTTYALFAGTSLGLSYSVIGAGFAFNGVLVVLGQASTTARVLGRRHTSIGILGTVCYVLGFLMLGVAARLGEAVLVIFFAGTAVITLGENLVTIPISTLPSNLAPAESIGAYNGVFGTVLGFGGLLATAVGGAALATIGDPLLLWIVLAAPALPAIGLLHWAGGLLPERPNRA